MSQGMEAILVEIHALMAHAMAQLRIREMAQICRCQAQKGVGVHGEGRPVGRWFANRGHPSCLWTCPKGWKPFSMGNS